MPRITACRGALAAAVLATALCASAAALADGDPASDVLASQPLFLPADGGFPQARATQLRSLLASAQRAGVPVRVALIATQADLGSVTELWRQPQNYANFLGQELSQVYRGMLVVAMPAGFGVASVGATPGNTASLTFRGGQGPLIAATVRVVEAVAAAEGHRLRPPPAVAASGSGSPLGSVDLGSWLALAGGAALIAVAWTASLRARRPARLRRAR